MSTAVNKTKAPRIIGLIAIIAGAVMVLGGGVTWGMVQSQLTAESITIPDDADMFPGKQVKGPLTAFAQADIINKHALAASDGKTYAELDGDDPVRATVMNGSFLRASLFTSVIAFGIAAFAMGLGALFILIGLAVRALAGPAVAAAPGAAKASTPGAAKAAEPAAAS